MNENAKVAIIGAGLAGLTAAHRLYQTGYEQVKFNESLSVITKEQQFTHYNNPVAKSWVSDPFCFHK